MDTMNRSGRLRALAALGIALFAVAGCEDDPAPPLAVTGTGAVEGLVFFDRGEDGIFDPSDGDYAVQGVGVAIQERGTGQSFNNGTTQSGADGRFRLEGMPAGTHDMLIDTLTVPAEVSICQNPLQITVNIGETRFANVRGRPGCLITIAEAKNLPIGEFAIVRGVVTSFPGQIEVGWTYIQDATAGSKIFSNALDGRGIEIGDQVEIGGLAEEFSNDFNFENVVFRSLVKNVATPVPMVVTTAAISASGSTWKHPLQGAFIRVQKAQLTAAFGAGGANIQNGTIDDGSGATIIRIDDGVADRNTLNTLMSVGKCYDINGFGANFAGAGQIFPRSLADIQEVACN